MTNRLILFLLIGSAAFFSNNLTVLAQVEAERQYEREKVIGEMSGEEVMARLAAIGDNSSVQSLVELGSLNKGKGQKSISGDTSEFSISKLNLEVATMSESAKKPFMHSTHAFGYVTKNVQNGRYEIVSASSIKPEPGLKGRPIKIVLSKVRIFDYPGRSGFRTVLFDFSAQHQVAANNAQVLNFSQKYRVQEGEDFGVDGRPIFIGLNVGKEGVFFRGSTVNVENEKDREMLAFLESSVFAGGMELINGVNPLIPIVSGFAQGIAKGILKKNENVAVQYFELGLDFSTGPVGSKLREGTYVIVQAPSNWEWSNWVFDPNRSTFVSKSDPSQSVPFNYVVITITKMS